MTAVMIGGARGASSSQPRLRMTARGRRVLAAIVALPIVVALAIVGLNSGSATATTDSAPLTYVSVSAGETLWQLATDIAPHSDPRDVIADIVSLNHLQTESLTAGESLAIPSQYER
jgi:hypothetical protein